MTEENTENIIFYPLAGIHKIVVDTYYRNLLKFFLLWKKNYLHYLKKKQNFKAWKTFTIAKVYKRKSLMEFISIIDNMYCDNDTIISPTMLKELLKK